MKLSQKSPKDLGVHQIISEGESFEPNSVERGQLSREEQQPSKKILFENELVRSHQITHTGNTNANVSSFTTRKVSNNPSVVGNATRPITHNMPGVSTAKYVN